ncbi:MAG: tRNA uridine-5-carboxymethylaminomethyl(34) synthesis GTPase MnmE [Desulfovibrio sp.]|nr:tRNA uridine-5-carboxymethylaminomethyl(34) synthesis GTPase MnmE [Desulfovibrio sp.]
MTTIVAQATARGRGAIGIVRLSGPASCPLLHRVFAPYIASFTDFRPWVLHRGRFVGEDGAFLDDILAVYMPGPKTYTGEDMAEIHCHGGPVILETVLRRLMDLGAEPASGGEFTKRAFLNGRMDLSQAEAVAELVNAASAEALKDDVRRLDGHLSATLRNLREAVDRLRAVFAMAVDFPDDEVESLDDVRVYDEITSLSDRLKLILAGHARQALFQEGARVVLAGAVNAGKSSLMNVLLGHDRAIVTDIPGTTRDFLEEACSLGGLSVRLTDTAGIRAEGTLDPIEEMGIRRGQEQYAKADCLLLLLDGTDWSYDELASETCPRAEYADILASSVPLILVWNKVDQKTPPFFPPAWAQDVPALCLSARTGEGVEELISRMRTLLLGETSPHVGEYVSCNSRQAAALSKAVTELQELRGDMEDGVSYDACCVRLDYIADILGDVIGVSTSADVLNDIFGRFCIGK